MRFMSSTNCLRMPSTLGIRLRPHPDAVVDHAAEMLDEMPIDVRADLRAGRRWGDLHLSVPSNAWRNTGDEADGSERTCRQKGSAIHSKTYHIDQTTGVRDDSDIQWIYMG